MGFIRTQRAKQLGPISKSMITSLEVGKSGSVLRAKVCCPFAWLRQWCPADAGPQVVDFVDESGQVAEDVKYTAGDDGSEEGDPISSNLLTQARTTAIISRSVSRQNRYMYDPSIRPVDAILADRSSNVPAAAGSVSSSPWQNTPSRSSVSPAPELASAFGELPPSSYRDIISSQSFQSGPPHYTPIVSPLNDPIEAHLFRFWVERVSAWWDITSSHNIFKAVVPNLALENSMLLNAIFMISAQHIRRFDPYFPARPYMYHERILQYLIPYLAEKGKIEDEATLVAAMLLRGFEEFHGKCK